MSICIFSTAYSHLWRRYSFFWQWQYFTLWNLHIILVYYLFISSRLAYFPLISWGRSEQSFFVFIFHPNILMILHYSSSCAMMMNDGAYQFYSLAEMLLKYVVAYKWSFCVWLCEKSISQVKSKPHYCRETKVICAQWYCSFLNQNPWNCTRELPILWPGLCAC